MNVGEYVRTNDGIIAKITDIIEDFSIDCDRDVFDLDNMAMMEIPWNFKNEYIIKTSPQIIDLIEVGDIVNYEQLNGGVVLNKKEDSIDTWSILPNSLKNKDIKSVITKEQLKNNMYIVGE